MTTLGSHYILQDNDTSAKAGKDIIIDTSAKVVVPE